MIVSMTGFGDAALDVAGVQYAAEVRSLNNRYFKASIRLPEEIAGLEPEIETLLRRGVGRGSVTCSLRLRADSAAAARRVNVAALNAYVTQLQSAHAIDGVRTADLATLLQLPGVLEEANGQADGATRHRDAVLRVTSTALEKLILFRRREGQTLGEELLRHVGRIQGHVKAIETRVPLVVAEYHRRLTSRVNELITRAELSVSEGDLIREVAVFAERSDVAEEVQRLRSHLDAFERACQSEDAPGRKLDFITQEMLREANTIGSKANDSEVAVHCVDIKGTIDRLKEQVQNVE